MTIRKTARFVVAPEHLDEALEAIRTFVDHTRNEPGTLTYQSWQSAAQSNVFLHLMEFEDATTEEAHRTSSQVATFTETLYPLCTEKPHFDDWSSVGETTRE